MKILKSSHYKTKAAQTDKYNTFKQKIYTKHLPGPALLEMYKRLLREAFI